MKGRKRFECKYKDSIQFADTKPQNHNNFISDFHKVNTSFTKTDKESFRHLKKRINRSVDHRETPVISKIINTVNEMDTKPIKMHKNISVLFSNDFYKDSSKIPKTRNDKSYQFEVTRTTGDDKAIDLYLIKHSLNMSGINVFKMQNLPNLTSTEKDKIVFSVREEDSNTNNFERIKVQLRQKGLQIKEVKNADMTKTRKTQADIYSAKNNWYDIKYIKKNDSVDIKRNQRKEM